MLPHHNTPGIVMYCTTHCKGCKGSADYMIKHGIAYHPVNLDKNKQLVQPLVQETGLQMTPQIFVDGQFLGGMRQLVEAHLRGML